MCLKKNFCLLLNLFLYNFTQLSKATFPSVTTTFSFFKFNISSSKKLEQFEISLLNGLSSGGTHLRILVIYVESNFKLSFKFFENGKFEIPTSYKHLNKKSPDLSPVKALPVLVPPWAAGARPIIANFESRFPNPGTGLPQ